MCSVVVSSLSCSMSAIPVGNTYVYTHTYVYLYTCIYVCVCVFVCVYVNLLYCRCIRMYYIVVLRRACSISAKPVGNIYIYIYVYTHAYIYTRIYMCVSAFVCVYVNRLIE